jgi:NADH-quinone oxidoreductase subunit N
MTISMLGLAGFPATAGFFGKIYLIQAAVTYDYAWLGVIIVLGSAVSLAYYLRVVAAVWMRSPAEATASRGGAARSAHQPAIAGGSPEADDEDRAAGREPGAGVPASRPDRGAVVASDFGEGAAAARPRYVQPEVIFVAVVCAVATLFFGIDPDPLFNVARDAGHAMTSLL